MSNNTENKDQQIPKCSFCGKELNDGSIIVGNCALACPECVELAHKVIQDRKDVINNTVLKNILKPKEIKAFLDQYIIGQDRVKERVSVAVYNHYKRINCNITDDVELEKSNILVCGPTGSGKCICGNTKVKIRNKKTGKIYYDTIDNLKNILIPSYSSN